MAEFFSDIYHWIEALSPAWAYVVILGIAYGENVVPPIPGDMIVVFGGYLAGASSLNFFLVWMLATLGGALGFMTMYAIGYVLGDAINDPNRFKFLPRPYLEKARVWLLEWGYSVVIANRFLSGTRSVISLSVGMARMNAWRTLFACTLSALAWTGVIGYAGYAVGDNWAVVSEYLRAYGWFILIGTIVFVGYVIYRKRLQKTSRPDYMGEDGAGF